MRIPGRIGLVLLSLFLVLVGCTPPPPAPPPSGPPKVLVATPVADKIADYDDFTGRTEAVASVEIRARVTGYLQKIDFKEGMLVKKGELLFEIDPRPYQAELARAEASIRQAEARLTRLNADYHRASNLRGRSTISQEDYEKIAGDRAEAEASVAAVVANRDLAKLNLEYTQVRAPLAGLISRHNIDAGNLVKSDETILTSIVATNPIYAYFDVDERTLLKIRRLIQSGKIKSARESKVAVLAALADEEGFPHTGAIDFVDNRVDSNTGTLRVRAVLDDDKGLIAPGLFVRVRVPLGEPAPVIMVAEQALGTDQGQKFVYVINEKDEAIYRRVQLGRLNKGLRVIKEGLAPNERIVVGGLQRIRPNSRVTPEKVPMPLPPGAEPASEAGKQLAGK